LELRHFSEIWQILAIFTKIALASFVEKRYNPATSDGFDDYSDVVLPIPSFVIYTGCSQHAQSDKMGRLGKILFLLPFRRILRTDPARSLPSA